ncbi:MAG: hypothetical protein WC752_01020 [Patescibacteria group bacterium]|jgi:hypothetical protein
MKKALFLAPALLLTVVILTGAGCQTTTTDTNTADADTNAAVTESSVWTDATDQGTIPDTTASGTLNGQDFTATYVEVHNWDDHYTVEFSNTAPDEECGVVMDNDAISFSTKDLQIGTFDKALEDELAFDDYNAYYYYEQESGTPMSVNVDWAGKLVVSNIDEATDTVTGWADFTFDSEAGEETAISGAFTAPICE